MSFLSLHLRVKKKCPKCPYEANSAVRYPSVSCPEKYPKREISIMDQQGFHDRELISPMEYVSEIIWTAAADLTNGPRFDPRPGRLFLSVADTTFVSSFHCSGWFSKIYLYFGKWHQPRYPSPIAKGSSNHIKSAENRENSSIFRPGNFIGRCTLFSFPALEISPLDYRM